MRIIFVRHGEAEIDKTRNQNHRTLTKKGKKQAKLLAKHLKKVHFDEFYSSDLLRAKQTSEIVSKKIRINSIIEKSLNEFESDFLKKDKKKLKKKDNPNYNNLIAFLKKISKNPEQDKKILIISHGNTNRIILSYFMNINLNHLIQFRQKETAINSVHWSKHFKNWRLDYWNNTEHLK